MSELLRDEGHTLDIASNGLQGLEKFRLGEYDLVVTDHAMPEMNGDEMAAAIKEVAPNKPIIVLSGFAGSPGDAGESPTRADLVLSKPITESELREGLVTVTAKLRSG